MHLGSPPNKGEEGYSKCEMYKVIRIMMTVGMMMMMWRWVEMELDVSGSWLDVGHDACCGELCQCNGLWTLNEEADDDDVNRWTQVLMMVIF